MRSPATQAAASISFVRAPSKAKKAALLLFSVAVLLTGGTAAVRGQSALDGFDPDANDTISVVVVQPDGKILIGGSFTSLSPNGGPRVTRNHIARLNPDGTLDTAFNPDANGFVNAIAVQADGQILVGGSFGGVNSIGGATRNFIARLDATTGSADSFDPNADNEVYAITVQTDGKILVGGSFSGAHSIGGATRNYIARLDATTGLADSLFDPNANGAVFSIAVQVDGKILTGGAFATIGGQTRHFIARLDATTGDADSFDPSANGIVRSIAVQADGKIIAGGQFSGANSIGGQTRNRIARLDATTGSADSFDPNANGFVFSVAVQADGKILAAGFFNGVNSIGGAARNYIARLNPITGLADSFDPNAGNIVQSIAVQSDGKIVAGGNFVYLVPNGGAPQTRNHIARMETDGRLDQTLDPNIAGNSVIAIAVQPDGKTLIGGDFTNVFGVTHKNIARLNTDGTLDTTFNAEANGLVYSIAVQPDGKILVGGDFHGANSIGGAARNYMARLYGTTGLADSFDPNADNTVFAIAVQPDGKILAGGSFTGIGMVTRNHIARLDPTSGAADSFNPDANNTVLSIAVQADGKILAGGDFVGTNSIGGQARSHIARLIATSGAADSFNPDAHGVVRSIAVQADGQILAGGYFSGPNSIGGATRNYIARLDAATGLADPLFKPNASNAVVSISVQADGKILAGGSFTTIGGQQRDLLARLSNDTIALQNLVATQNTITWTHGESVLIVSNSTTQIRGGASPQFTRVTFESSTDNLNYNFIGNGTPAGGDWTLTGLNLSTGQNLYIRARGYSRSGYQNASESITESVRNAFLTPLAATPPLLNIQLSAPTNIVLSWWTNFTGFTLEANTNLTTNVWSVVSPAPAVSGTNNVVTNTVSVPARFYRLRR